MDCCDLITFWEFIPEQTLEKKVANRNPAGSQGEVNITWYRGSETVHTLTVVRRTKKTTERFMQSEVVAFNFLPRRQQASINGQCRAEECITYGMTCSARLHELGLLRVEEGSFKTAPIGTFTEGF
jgi:hypothetical protein